MYLHSAWKQINSLILSSDLDTSKVNPVRLRICFNSIMAPQTTDSITMQAGKSGSL